VKSALIAVSAAILLASLPAAAEWNDPNVAGTREYRLIKLYPQAHVMQYEAKDFDSAKMLIDYKAGTDDPGVYDDIEGKVITYAYEHKPTTSALEIERNYEAVLRGKGFEPIIAGRATRYPGLGLDVEDTIGYWRWEEPGKGMVWVSLHVYYNGSHEFPESRLTIVETRPMQQTLQGNAATEAKPASLADALQQNGRVAVYGITFDFNKASIRPEAAPVMAQVLAMLQADTALQLTIEGHTDSIGRQAYNQTLSADRAEAVKAWLAAHGVEAARLTSVGFGDTRPLADNAAEQGRSQNRRVELVRR
jgi:OmpA-OmpF porin, OOP family